MKNYIIVILLCFFSSNAYAQKIEYSKPIKLTNKTPRFKILGRNANYFIAERWGSKFHYLDLYNANLKRVSSKELRLDTDESLKKIWIQPKKGWIVYTKATKDFTLIEAKQLDIKLNIRNTAIRLDSIVERKDLVQSNLRTSMSLNEKYFATYIPIFSKGTLDYFMATVYDQNLKEVQKVKLKSSFVRQGSFVDLLVLNNGELIAVFKEKASTNSFEIYHSISKGNIKKHSLKLDNEVFKKLKFEVDNLNNTLLIAGFKLIQENKRVKAANAMFSLKLDLQTGAFSKKTTEVFTQEFYKLLTGKESKSDVVSLQTFYIKTIIPRLDGGYLVFAESFYENEESIEIPQSTPISGSSGGLILGQASFSPSTTYKTSYYHYNDVIVYTLTDSMEMQSVNIIKKRQKSEEDNGGYSSFKIANQQNMLEVLFLDEISINSSLKRYTLNQDSEIFKDYILNVEQNNVMPVVKLAVQTAPNEILVPSYLNNSFSIIKIVFEDNN